VVVVVLRMLREVFAVLAVSGGSGVGSWRL
jgi:hypothetical protein